MASGFKVNVKHPGSNKVIAVSRDLLKKYPFGTFIKVQGKGVWQVQDVMAPRFKKRIDLLIDYKAKHNKFTNIIISKYERKRNIKISNRRSSVGHNLQAARKHKKVQARRKRTSSRQFKNRAIHSTNRTR